ncbi:MAG: sulfite exporter TauE/SafE family protein [Firmicutes bacterium]|nr:sulfite exporter TauE/SafE family protein [Bacillota bacterium]
MEISIGLIAVLAGIVQGVTGFGSGPILMMLLPVFFALPQAAGVSISISVFLNLSIANTYKKYIKFKKILPVCVIYIFICSIGIQYSTMVDQALMKKVFGIFLVLLSIYNLFIAKHTKADKLSLLTSFVFIVISALCDAFFGIGGPLMVIYFMTQTKAKEEYLGTITTFFLINGVFNTILRVINGILVMEYVPVIACGVLGIVSGAFIGKKIVNLLNGEMLKKVVYVTIGLSGLLNLLP